MFTRITGDQKRYVEELKFKIIDDCSMGFAKNNPNKYCKVDDALVHLGTFYEEMYMVNPDAMVQELTHPVKRQCVRKIKIEEAVLRAQTIEYSKKYPDKTIDDLIAFLEDYYKRDVKQYMDIIKGTLCGGLKKASI